MSPISGRLFRCLPALALPAFALLLSAIAARSAELYLTNLTTSSAVALDVGGNWSAGGVPGTLDGAWLTNRTTQTYSLGSDLVTANAYFDSLYGRTSGNLYYKTNSLAGWTWTVTNSLVVAASNSSSNVVVLASGTLAVTNGNKTAALILGQGTASQGGFTLAGGTLVADTLIATNSLNGSPLLLDKGTIEVRNGSTLVQTNTGISTYTIGAGGPLNLTLSGGTNNFRLSLTGSGGLFTRLTQTVVRVIGPSTVWSNFTAVNLQGSDGRIVVSNGATAVFASTASSALRVGTYAGNTNNVVLVDGSNSTLFIPNAGILYVGQGGTDNRFVVTNGARAILGAASSFEIGASNSALVTGSGSTLSNAAGYISRGADTQLILADGAVARFVGAVQPGYMPGSNQLLKISSGATFVGSFALGNRANGGQGVVVVEDGGIAELSGATVGFNGTSAPTNGWGVVTNRGGTFRFTTASPSITINTNNAGGAANIIVVTNATVEFSGVTNAAIAGEITKFTYQGANTLALNSATNAVLGSYTISSGSSFSRLDLRGSGSLFQATNLSIGVGGSLVGAGGIQGLVVSNAGTIAPGHSPGTLNFSSNLTLLDSSLLVMEIASTNAGGYDRLVASGAMARAGTLTITNLGWTFSSGDSFDLFDFGSWSGVFSVTNLPELAVGLSWDLTSFESSGILSVSGLPVPEPSPLLAVGAGLALLAFSRRRTAA